MSAIQMILGKGGLLSQAIENFEHRDYQIHMAELIQKAIKDEAPAIMESGTGTGKTLSYLVPSILSGKKVIVSTATKNLQEQIFLKDIPMLSRAMGLDIDAVLVKGRKNYLCLNRLARMSDPELMKDIFDRARRTEFADISEIGLTEKDELSCSTDECLGSKCPYKDHCYVNKLRERAPGASVIVTNHHLFFADLMLKSEGLGEILPPFQVAILDEAHKTEEIASNSLGKSISTYRLRRFAESTAAQLSDIFSALGKRGRLTPKMIQIIRLPVMKLLTEELRYIRDESVQGQVERLVKDIEFALSSATDGYLRWYENRPDGHVVIQALPLDVAPYLRKNLYSGGKSVIYTSATLSTDSNLDYFRSRVGLTEDTVMGIFPSHFDFANQTKLFIPQDICDPKDPDFIYQAANNITELINITDGRALVLFTSYRNMQAVYDLVKNRILHQIIRQGDDTRSVVLQKFKEDIHSVLFATRSFWQGIDVQGESLSNLIIDKLPFDSHEDPLVAARMEAVTARGGNAFMEYQLPSAVIDLKQGLGRLIRSNTDHGILSILDNRLLTSHYGQSFLNSLPGMPLTSDMSDLVQFMEDKEE